MRFSAAFIASCMLVIAGSLGAVAWLMLAISAVEALATAVTAFGLLAAWNALSARARERASAARQVAELSRGTTDLAHQVGDLGRRLVKIEAALAGARAEARAAVAPLGAEIETLGTLVNQLAESVAAHEDVLLTQVAAVPAPFATTNEPFAAMPEAIQPAAEPSTIEYAADTAAPPPADMLARVQSALADNRFELHLHPIVMLPQRKVRHYEAVIRLRTEEGDLLAAAEFRRAAESGGLMPGLDKLMLLRAVQVARRLTARNREAVLFFTLSRTTLANTEILSEIHEFLAASRTLAPALVFVLAQEAPELLPSVEQQAMAQLTSLGFRFALLATRDLRLDPLRLSAQGFRFVKAPASLVLDRRAVAAADIHAADLANLLNRYGVGLIADGVEAEATVADLLDYDVRFAQGGLFAPARPVRAEVFQPAAEQAAAPPPEATATPATEAAPAKRRREPDPAARQPAERTPQALVKIARNIMRRA